jgi:hypothetical protein
MNVRKGMHGTDGLDAHSVTASFDSHLLGMQIASEPMYDWGRISRYRRHRK